MAFGSLDAIVLIAYFVGITWLGISTARRIHSSGDYFAGGRRFNKWLMMMHSLGTGTHADDPVNVAGAAYERGVSGVWYTYAYLFVTPFYWLIAPLFRRMRYLTTADFFDRRYGRSMGILYTVLALLIFTINIGTMLKGTGLIAGAVTGGLVPEWVAVLVMTVLFVAYGAAGGLIATVITESIQGMLIVVMSLLLVPFGLMRLGGFSGLHQVVAAKSTTDMFSLHAPEEITLFWIVMASIGSLVNIMGQPHTMEVCATGKTEWEGRVGFTYGSIIKRVCAMGWVFTGIIVYAMFALDKREAAFGTAIRELLPQGFTGLMAAAIMAAQMSTLSAFMVASSALVSRNIYKRLFRPEATDAQVLWVGRVSSVSVVLGGILFALAIPGVAEGVTIFWDMCALPGLLIWAGILWRRANRTGAWCSFIVMLVIWGAIGPLGAKLKLLFPDAALLGMYSSKADLPWRLLSYLPAGIVAMALGSLLTKPEAEEKVGQFYRLLRTPVGQEAELELEGVEVLYAGDSEPHPWEVRHPRLVAVVGFFVALAVSSAMLAVLWGLARLGA